MSGARYVVDRRVGAPPETVLAAIREAIGSTRRADLPPAQQRGVRGLAGTVRGERFTVRMDETEGDLMDLSGWVLAAEEGESRVHARVQEDRHAGVTVAVVLAIAAVFGLTGGSGAWWIAGFAAVIGAVAFIRRAGGYMDHARAAFLTQWLHGVLGRLPSPASPPSVPEPSGPEPASRTDLP